MKKITAKFPNAKILVADDVEINIELLTGMLELMNCNADTAKDGQETWDMCCKNKYDVILLDLLMPKMDGFEITKKIRHECDINKETIIIAITANTIEEDRLKCIESGMNDYITKPIKCEILEEKLLHYLESRDNG